MFFCHVYDQMSSNIFPPTSGISILLPFNVLSLALGHDEPVSVGCPLYNEALVVKDCLILSSNVISRG